MNKEDFSSESDESDEDYCPEGDEANIPSEAESEGEIEEPIENENQLHGKRKRKKPQTNIKNKSRKIEDEEQDIPEVAGGITEEDEKKKADALWADFLGDSNKETNATTIKKSINGNCSKAIDSEEVKKESPVDAKKITITEIFEFAGEKIKVTKDVPADSITILQGTTENKPVLGNTSLKAKTIPHRIGIGALLGKIDKRNKISTLEKTKLDWDSFKRNEGIDEELQTHNKGKDGYLERQDFLERTDLRQFDIEKNYRTTKRSAR